MIALSGPRVHTANAYWYRWLEVDDAIARRSRPVLTKALRDGQHLTRVELGEALTRAKIAVESPQRLTCIVMRAELDGLICSGARRVKQFTYALLEERVPKSNALERDAALFELARRYFATRGPATVDDFSWWSGLTKADAKRGVEAASKDLQHQPIDCRLYWFPTPQRTNRKRGSVAHLLPNYDEFFVGLKDRTAFGTRLASMGVRPRTSALSGHALTVDAQIVGGWTRTMARGKVVIRPTPQVRLSDAERRAVAAAAQRFGRFLDMPAEVRWP